MGRIVHVDPATDGIRRKGAGKGFYYLRADGTKVTPGEDLERIRSLAIPPAWREVWICPRPDGHIQATGVDGAGRRQYIYHPDWVAERQAEKFDRSLSLGWALPNARRKVTLDLRSRGTTARRAQAMAFRILDSTGMRIGSREYARTNGTYGVSTLEVHHARVHGSALSLQFTGKGGQEWTVSLEDSDLAKALRPMLGRAPAEQLLGARDDHGTWRNLGAEAINDYIRTVTGDDFTAKDLRTLIKEAVDVTAQFLADTPKVTQDSYIDPRLFDAFLDGEAPPRFPVTESAVRELLDSRANL
ncbi:DNA topoisomerase-1 [Brevibacterium sanguinis]|uniref:DNA topoisomerase-1 n=2 Tax=Brevibacterium TaxID=1696 RepID=A0A366ILE6_9MICO|nr:MULTISPECIES: DNA topoisomerase IB [Brevibacterium]RBP65458.1 DNA topoisomerase-1 [Brevibacterium sanguinis]RBP72092.1 DNA topoisomerase-1 [Brevibacterium celere]